MYKLDYEKAIKYSSDERPHSLGDIKGFLRNREENPHNPLTNLVMADYLEENGHDAIAKHIRKSVEQQGDYVDRYREGFLNDYPNDVLYHTYNGHYDNYHVKVNILHPETDTIHSFSVTYPPEHINDAIDHVHSLHDEDVPTVSNVKPRSVYLLTSRAHYPHISADKIKEIRKRGNLIPPSD